MHGPEYRDAAHAFGFAARRVYWSGPFPEPFWDQTTVFFKTRMRRLLRRMIAAAAPHGLRPDRRAVAEQALMLERAAAAFGATWHGLSPAQAVLVVMHAARAAGLVEAERLAAAAGRFAAGRGLVAFSAGIARDLARQAAPRRPGHPPGLGILA